MLFLDKISVGSPAFGGRGGRGTQPRALAGKGHTVLGLGRDVHFGQHGELLGSQHAKIATGGAEPLAKEQETGASGNLLSAGAQAQADSCGAPCSGKTQERLNPLEIAFLCSPGLSPNAALLLTAV